MTQDCIFEQMPLTVFNNFPNMHTEEQQYLTLYAIILYPSQEISILKGYLFRLKCSTTEPLSTLLFKVDSSLYCK